MGQLETMYNLEVCKILIAYVRNFEGDTGSQVRAEAALQTWFEETFAMRVTSIFKTRCRINR